MAPGKRIEFETGEGNEDEERAGANEGGEREGEERPKSEEGTNFRARRREEKEEFREGEKFFVGSDEE
jgi:hypothetical protein